MKICLVGPGIMQIPPKGWGAVEILIWDYYNTLKEVKTEVTIINKIRNSPIDQNNPNTKHCKELINEINNGNYNFVHIHYDCLYHIIPYIQCKKIGFTSHYPYIDKIEMHRKDGFTNIFNFMVNNDKFYHFVLAQKDIEFLTVNGAKKENLFKLENGVDINKFKFINEPLNGNKTIYLGKISSRKGQHKYNSLNNLDIIGPGGNNLNNWKGEWTREEVYLNLSQYGNLLLLSSGEADPLVVKEALICGLGVVVNQTSSKNLEANDFIHIIEDEDMNNLDLIQKIIDNNKEQSLKIRKKIKKYGEEKFGWNNLIEHYLNVLNI